MAADSHITPTEIQPQLSQLQLIFKGPLVKDSIVNKLNDLITLDIRYNYEHKIVWVKEAKSNYYLTDGDGSMIEHWSKVSSSALIPQYNSNDLYQPGDIVLYLGKLYVATEQVPINTNPADNKDVWTPIKSDSVSYRYMFVEQSSCLIYTEITNPIFEVGTCTFETTPDDNYVIDTDGLVKTVNYEHISCDFIQRSDLPNNNGRPYEFTFFENSLPVKLTGVINIR